MTIELNITTTREVTSEEVSNVVHGCGALGYGWWKSVQSEERDGVTGYVFEIDDPDVEDATLTKWVSEQEIVTAASKYLESVRPWSNDERDAATDDLGFFDANGADSVLQIAVLGEVAYG